MSGRLHLHYQYNEYISMTIVKYEYNYYICSSTVFIFVAQITETFLNFL